MVDNYRIADEQLADKFCGFLSHRHSCERLLRLRYDYDTLQVHMVIPYYVYNGPPRRAASAAIVGLCRGDRGFVAPRGGLRARGGPQDLARPRRDCVVASRRDTQHGQQQQDTVRRLTAHRRPHAHFRCCHGPRTLTSALLHDGATSHALDLRGRSCLCGL